MPARWRRRAAATARTTPSPTTGFDACCASKHIRIACRHGECSGGVAMEVPSFTEVHAWQLANELHVKVAMLVRAAPARKGRRLRARLRTAVASAPRQIAEALRRAPPWDLQDCLRHANGAVEEARRGLEQGCDRGYFTPADVEPLLFLAGRAAAAITSLARYADAAPITRPGGG